MAHQNFENLDPIYAAHRYLASNSGEPAARVIVKNLLDYIAMLSSIRYIDYRVHARLESLSSGALREEQP